MKNDNELINQSINNQSVIHWFNRALLFKSWLTNAPHVFHQQRSLIFSLFWLQILMCHHHCSPLRSFYLHRKLLRVNRDAFPALKPSYSPRRWCWGRWRDAWHGGWPEACWGCCCINIETSTCTVMLVWVDCCSEQVVKVDGRVRERQTMGRTSCKRWEV